MDETNYGIDIKAGLFKPSELIAAAKQFGGKLRLHGQLVDDFDNLMKKIIQTDPNAYSTDINENALYKINGVDWENFLVKYSNGWFDRNSAAVFSIDAAYEKGSDFTTSKTAFPSNRPVEAKNFFDVESVATARCHTSLYVLANDRQNSRFVLLCKLTKADKENPTGLVIHGVYKEIKRWKWLNRFTDAYVAESMQNSWKIERGIDDCGRYIEFISPKLSNSRRTTYEILHS